MATPIVSDPSSRRNTAERASYGTTGTALTDDLLMVILSLTGTPSLTPLKAHPAVALSKGLCMKAWAPDQVARWLVDSYGLQKALNKAARAGKYPVVKALLENFGCRADASNSEALCLAAKCGHLDVCQLLLSQPEHPARADDCHSAALREAATSGCFSVCQLLLETASHCPGHLQRARLLASQRGHPKVSSLLSRYMYSA